MKADIIVSRHPQFCEYLRAIGLADRNSQVLPFVPERDEHRLTGKVVIGMIPFRLARRCKAVWDVVVHIPPGTHMQDYTAADLLAFRSILRRSQVEYLGDWKPSDTERPDLIVSRHSHFRAYARWLGLTKHETPLLTFVGSGQEQELDDRIVLGGLPYFLASRCREVWQIELETPRKMDMRSVTLDQYRAYSKGVRRYKVHNLGRSEFPG